MQVRPVPLAPADHVVNLAYQDLQDHQAHVARLVQWGLEDHPAKQHREKLASPDLLGNLAHLGPRARKARVVRQASEERRDSRVHQAPGVSWDRPDPRGRRVRTVRFRARPVQQVTQERPALLGRPPPLLGRPARRGSFR